MKLLAGLEMGEGILAYPYSVEAPFMYRVQLSCIRELFFRVCQIELHLNTISHALLSISLINYLHSLLAYNTHFLDYTSLYNLSLAKN